MADDSLHPLLATQRQRSLILRVIRFVFFIIIVTVALVTLFNEAGPPGTETGISLEVPWWLPVIIAVGLFAVALLIDLATPNKKISTISGVFLGLFAGLLATVALSLLLDLVLGAWLPANIVVNFKAFTGLIKLLIGISLCYLGIVTVLQTQDEFRLVIPYVEFSKQIRGVKPLLVDTSALVDGRIVDLAASGLLQSTIIIPRFVIQELQTLADSQDKLKRSRGRRGLDAVGKLQRTGRVDVAIEEPVGLPVALPGPTGVATIGSGGLTVDQALVELAQQLSARIVTTDTGLARVAQIQGLIVLNLHDLAAAMRQNLIPGESLTLGIVRKGEMPGQGVAYLEDGTMVVVEKAADRIGGEVNAVVVSTMQTAGGRMVFARLSGGDLAGSASSDQQLAGFPTSSAPHERQHHAAEGETITDAAGPVPSHTDGAVSDAALRQATNFADSSDSSFSSDSPRTANAANAVHTADPASSERIPPVEDHPSASGTTPPATGRPHGSFVRREPTGRNPRR